MARNKDIRGATEPSCIHHAPFKTFLLTNSAVGAHSSAKHPQVQGQSLGQRAGASGHGSIAVGKKVLTRATHAVSRVPDFFNCGAPEAPRSASPHASAHEFDAALSCGPWVFPERRGCVPCFGIASC